MTITGQSSLNKDDISQMIKDAEAHADEDRRRKEEAEVRNNADSLVYQTDKMLAENGDKVSGAEKDTIEANLASLKEALNGTDVEAIKSATEKLVTSSQTFAQKLYEQAAASQAPGEPEAPADAANDDDVIDAEIVDE
jgi:molecular chaperone DnaK